MSPPTSPSTQWIDRRKHAPGTDEDGFRRLSFSGTGSVTCRETLSGKPLEVLIDRVVKQPESLRPEP